MLLHELFDKDNCELTLNESGNPRVAGYELVNTAHILQRAEQRNIPRAVIASMLNRLGRVKWAIKEYGEFPGVRIYDSVNDVYIPMRLVPDTNRLQLITVHRTDPEGPNTAREFTVKIR